MGSFGALLFLGMGWLTPTEEQYAQENPKNPGFFGIYTFRRRRPIYLKMLGISIALGVLSAALWILYLVLRLCGL